jgi:hypothetical protein
MKNLSLGFYISVATVIMTVVTFVLAIMTPPFSGPLCKASVCYSYPYSDILSRFPRDYYWMYPAIILMLVFVVLMVCIHRYATPEKKIFSTSGLIFAVIASVLLLTDYFIQISVVQQSLIHGETQGIALLSQFNPHGIFIVVEELGFSIMSLAFLCMAPVFGGTTVSASIRWTFVSAFVLTIISFVTISLIYGITREYRFEIAAITIQWLALIISGVLLSILFKNNKNLI